MLELRKVSKSFFPGTPNERRALVDVDLSLAPGDFVTIIGGNGAGKSTLFNAVAGNFLVDAGNILLDGKNITCCRSQLITGQRFIERHLIYNPATCRIDQNCSGATDAQFRGADHTTGAVIEGHADVDQISRPQRFFQTICFLNVERSHFFPGNIWVISHKVAVKTDS